MNARIFRLFMFLPVFLWFAPTQARAVDESVIELVVQENDNLINLCKKHLAGRHHRAAGEVPAQDHRRGRRAVNGHSE